MNPAEQERKFAELYDQYRARLQRLCLGFTGSRQDAEDLLQDVLMRAWDGLPDFRGDAAIGTWLYRIAVNSALLFRRKRAPALPLMEVPEPGAGLQAGLEQREAVARLHSAIAGLRDTDRVIATLLLEDLSYKDIAEITGLTVNHVGVKIVRIKQALLAALQETHRGRA